MSYVDSELGRAASSFPDVRFGTRRVERVALGMAAAGGLVTLLPGRTDHEAHVHRAGGAILMALGTLLGLWARFNRNVLNPTVHLCERGVVATRGGEREVLLRWAELPDFRAERRSDRFGGYVWLVIAKPRPILLPDDETMVGLARRLWQAQVPKV